MVPRKGPRLSTLIALGIALAAVVAEAAGWLPRLTEAYR